MWNLNYIFASNVLCPSFADYSSGRLQPAMFKLDPNSGISPYIRPRPITDMFSQYTPFSTNNIMGLDTRAPLQPVTGPPDSTIPPQSTAAVNGIDSSSSPLLVQVDSNRYRHHNNTAETPTDQTISIGLANTKISGCEPSPTSPMTVTTLKNCETPVSEIADDKLNDGNKSESEDESGGKPKGIVLCFKFS